MTLPLLCAAIATGEAVLDLLPVVLLARSGVTLFPVEPRVVSQN